MAENMRTATVHRGHLTPNKNVPVAVWIIYRTTEIIVRIRTFACGTAPTVWLITAMDRSRPQQRNRLQSVVVYFPYLRCRPFGLIVPLVTPMIVRATTCVHCFSTCVWFADFAP